ncbi:MAG: pyridoxal phosphate-dependent aminotransferase [Polyangiales bacterium]
MPRYPSPARSADGLSPAVYSSLLSLAEESGHEVFALNVGDTYLEPPHAARVQRLADAPHPGLHRYADVRGEPALIEAIVADHARRGLPIDRERLQITAGGTSGLDVAARTLLEPGDELILLAPYWPLIRGIVRATGAQPVELPLFTELRKPGFDLRATLEGALTERTAAIYVNSPNNPTGVVLNDDEIAIIADFADEHGLWVLSDEAYERLGFESDARPRLPTVWTHPTLLDRTVVMHTLSKSFALAGARIGYLHGPTPVMQRIAGLNTFTNYCAARPMQLAAARALSPDSDAWLAEARARYRAAAEQTAKALRIPVPEGGTFVFFNTRPYLHKGETPEALLERCARAGVVLTPGVVAGAAYRSWARLCFTCVPPSVLTRALATLQRLLYAGHP